MHFLELRQVTKRFGKTIAVNSLELTVDKGELLFLLGPSGCGKTTVLRLIAGLESPDNGTVVLGGRDVTGLPPQERSVGFVFQQYALWPHMTVAEHIRFGLQVNRQSATQQQSAVSRVLSLVQLEGYERRYPHELSGGQQQRVALARALVLEPSILLLDEPLSNLDPVLRTEMRAEIERLNRDLGLTMIFVTHEQEEAFSLASRIAVMKDGNLLQVGEPESLYQQPASPFVASFLGNTNFIEAQIKQESGVPYLSFSGLRVFHPQAASFPEDTEVVLAVRPESISPRAQPGSASFSATVLTRRFLGSRIEHTHSLGAGVNLISESVPRELIDPKEGETVTLYCRFEDLLIMPKSHDV